MKLYLGTHEPSWLGRTDVPLFLSRVRLARQKSWRRAQGPWALDSGGFSTLTAHGCWTITPEHYVAEVRRWSAAIGKPDFAASMDWMCEDIALKKTGKTIQEHQELSIDNFLTLRELAPEIPWMPVLQGRTIGDYWRHVDEWIRRGVNLVKEPIVGVGSVCRLQATKAARPLFATLRAEGLKLHGLGLKSTGFRSGTLVHSLASSDSLAWSMNAYRNPQKRLPGHAHKTCANCFEYAMKWRDELLEKLALMRPARFQEGESMPPPTEVVMSQEAVIRRYMTVFFMTLEARMAQFESPAAYHAHVFANGDDQSDVEGILGLDADWDLPSKTSDIEACGVSAGL